MKNRILNIFMVLVLIAGLSLLAYPTFSDYWNYYHQSRAISTYNEKVKKLDDGTEKQMIEEAEAYNEKLKTDQHFVLSESEQEEYEATLNIGDGMMGYVDIPSIDVSLPIYHGTDEAVLQIAAGHLEGSSLPVGGVGTHSVISGHRGLMSAKLFSDIVDLKKGDYFMIRVLNRTITYQVDQMNTVLPSEMDELLIDPNQDYCTLVTCTPLGVNSHRYLVRGHRVANLSDDNGEVAIDKKLNRMILIVCAIIAAIILIIIVLIVRKKRAKKHKKKKKRKPSKSKNKKKKSRNSKEEKKQKGERT